MSVELRYRAIQTLNNFPSGYAIDSMQHAEKHTLRCSNSSNKCIFTSFKTWHIIDNISKCNNNNYKETYVARTNPRALPGSVG